MQYILNRFVKPKPIPKIDFSKGIDEENISMVMKDDKEYKLYGNDKQDIVAETYEFREENKLASYTALWNQSVNIKDIVLKMTKQQDIRRDKG